MGNQTKYKMQRLFSYHRYATGHVICGVFNWCITYEPAIRCWTASNRSLPWARFGLRADQMKAFHIRMPKWAVRKTR